MIHEHRETQRKRVLIVLFSVIVLLLIVSALWLGIRSKRMEPYLIVLKKGQPAITALMETLKKQGVSSCSISGLGALENPQISYYNLETQQYIPHTFEGVFEVASLNGNISELDNVSTPHIHVVLGNDQYQAIAGHLNQATVGGTLEITVVPFTRSYKRQKDPDTGLNLIR